FQTEGCGRPPSVQERHCFSKFLTSRLSLLVSMA
ncbi:hypothetical protein DBR06_SOUSAS33410003, partial [Sousa chinensis]